MQLKSCEENICNQFEFLAKTYGFLSVIILMKGENDEFQIVLAPKYSN